MATGKETCILVTLIRGRMFSMTDPQDPNTAYLFERNVPKALPKGKDHIADLLNDEVDVITDPDGQEFEKPKFKIQYNAQVVVATSAKQGPNGKKRIRLKAPGSDVSDDGDQEEDVKPRIRPRRPVRS